MKKIMFSLPILALLLICAVTTLAGCNRNPANEYGAVRLSRDTRYYNDYLGFSYAIPRNWWVYDINEYNLSISRGEIDDDISMDIALGKYENYLYSNIWLMAFGNVENVAHNNHLGFGFDARLLDGINDIAGFMEYFEIFMLEPTVMEEYSLLDSQQINIAGKTFELREYLVTREDMYFNVITLSCQVKQGYFLNISVDFWPDNQNARQTIIDSVSRSVEFY